MHTLARRILAPAAAIAALAPAAAAAELPANLKDLVAEGEKWFNIAGDTDLETGKRNEARRKAYEPLYEANRILNDHWDKHPSDQSKIEDMLMKVGQMLHWIRKESPMGVLPKPPAEAGGYQNDWGPRPPDAPTPPGPASPPPGPSGGPPAPAPATPAPAAPKPPSLADLVKAADDYAKKHRFDTPGILERYQYAMAMHPNPSDADFVRAAEAAGKAQAALKDVYRKLRDQDPDSLKDVDRQEVRRLVIQLVREFDSRDPAVRERAARLVGLLGSADAVYPLVSYLKKETEEQTAQTMGKSIVSIGGRKAAEHLTGLRSDAKVADRAFTLLEELSKRNPVDRRIALKEMGKWVLVDDGALAQRAADCLVAAGAEGSDGLVDALATRNTDTRIAIIGALGRGGNHRVASDLSKFLIGGDVPATQRTKAAAEAAIEALGEKAVPYLMHGLRNPTTKMWTGALLFKMTGQRFSSSRPGDWQAWWKQTHPDWKEGD